MKSAFDRKPEPAHPLETWVPQRRGSIFGFGLQGKLIVTFLAMVTVALGSGCWLFATQGRSQLNDLTSEETKLMVRTLAVAATPAFAGNRKNEMHRVGSELLGIQNILYVEFLGLDRKSVANVSRYADLAESDVSGIDPAPDSITPLPHQISPTFGEYIEILCPVFTTPNAAAVAKGDQPKKLGYVLVGMSFDGERANLTLVNWIMLGVGLLVVLASLPVVGLLVYNIFKPIRQLVDATRKIAMGQLNVDLDINRNDLIGELAESFQEMVGQVRRQREDLATTNHKLAEANEKLNDANRQLSQANVDLEMKVVARTGELQTANQRLSSEIAEKEEFLRAVSHDLNAPLRNIAGMATMLLSKNRDKFDADVIHRLERIQKNVEVETDLISELLELSRIKTRRSKLEQVEVDTLVRDLAGVFEGDLQGRQISMHMDTALPDLWVEKARIRQVFQNLIDNAIKYMGSQPVREIHVGCAIRNNEAEFYIRDTGIGIEEADISRVFSVFRRGRSAAVQNVAGKGVGLSSVKSIVETYFGTIWVESQFGKGSTFKFTINGKFIWNGQPPTALESEPVEAEGQAVELKAA